MEQAEAKNEKKMRSLKLRMKEKFFVEGTKNIQPLMVMRMNSLLRDASDEDEVDNGIPDIEKNNKKIE
jgi:hypothetical protein